MIHAGPAAAAGMTVMMTIAVDTVVMGNATTTEDTVDVMIADTTIAEVTIPEKVLSYPPDISYKWRTMFCFSQSRNDSANLSLQIATTMAHALTDMVAVEAETTATIAVEVEEDTMIVMIETPVAPATHPQLPVTVIQHLLGSLTVAATLMRDTPVESSDC